MNTHATRIGNIESDFGQAIDQLMARLHALDDAAATRQSASGWTPAQIGVHDALTNDFLAAVIRGDVKEMSVPRQADFTESLATLQLPDKVKTFSALEPPADASKADAVARLRQSGQTFEKALPTVTPERCVSTCIKMPFGVVFSLYEVGEFATSHVHRHVAQVDRAAGA
jgi:hypothetical protein